MFSTCTWYTAANKYVWNQVAMYTWVKTTNSPGGRTDTSHRMWKFHHTYNECIVSIADTQRQSRHEWWLRIVLVCNNYLRLHIHVTTFLPSDGLQHLILEKMNILLCRYDLHGLNQVFVDIFRNGFTLVFTLRPVVMPCTASVARNKSQVINFARLQARTAYEIHFEDVVEKYSSAAIEYTFYWIALSGLLCVHEQ